MKILYILAHCPQNSESYVDAELSYVLSKGVQVEVWSPTAGYGDPPKVPVRRGPLKDAIAGFRPDAIHIHHMTTAAYYIDQLPKGSVTVRAHSFDWDDWLAARLVANPAVHRVFAFPHLAKRVEGIVPMPVAYDPTLYYRSEKDKNSVVRLSAGLLTKRLEDFIVLGNKLFAHGNFTLALNCVIGKESLVVNKLSALNDSLGGHVYIKVNLSKADAAALVRSAAIYVSTYDEHSHVFGMPISIAEALATGAFVIAREADGVSEYMGEAKVTYNSVVKAEELVRLALSFKGNDWKSIGDVACRTAERFRSDVVLPPLIAAWNYICLENF